MLPKLGIPFTCNSNYLQQKWINAMLSIALVKLPYPISTLKCKTFENTKMLKHRLESTFMEHKSYFSGWSAVQTLQF